MLSIWVSSWAISFMRLFSSRLNNILWYNTHRKWIRSNNCYGTQLGMPIMVLVDCCDIKSNMLLFLSLL
jgi:hypothetical protein